MYLLWFFEFLWLEIYFCCICRWAFEVKVLTNLFIRALFNFRPLSG